MMVDIEKPSWFKTWILYVNKFKLHYFRIRECIKSKNVQLMAISKRYDVDGVGHSSHCSYPKTLVLSWRNEGYRACIQQRIRGRANADSLNYHSELTTSSKVPNQKYFLTRTKLRAFWHSNQHQVEAKINSKLDWFKKKI